MNDLENDLMSDHAYTNPVIAYCARSTVTVLTTEAFVDRTQCSQGLCLDPLSSAGN